MNPESVLLVAKHVMLTEQQLKLRPYKSDMQKSVPNLC